MAQKIKDIYDNKNNIIVGFITLAIGLMFFICGVLEIIRDINSEQWLECNA